MLVSREPFGNCWGTSRPRQSQETETTCAVEAAKKPQGSHKPKHEEPAPAPKIDPREPFRHDWDYQRQQTPPAPKPDPKPAPPQNDDWRKDWDPREPFRYPHNI